MSKYIGTPVVSLVTDTVDVTGDITTTDATPEVIIINNTSEDTDGGREGKITFKGRQSGGEETTLAQIQASHDSTSDDQKGDIIFRTNDGSDGSSPTEAMRIDSDQRVGIGTTSLTAPLDVRSSGASGKAAEFHNSTGYGIDIGNDSTSVAYISSGYLQALAFKTDPSSGQTERMRIDSSGNVLVDKTASDGGVAGHELRKTDFAVHTVASTVALIARRLTDDGNVLTIQGNSGTVGHIGCNSGDMYMGDGDTTIFWADSPNVIGPAGTAGATRDNAISFGNSSNRWSQLFAGTSTIGTSDENEKQQIASLTDAEIAAAKAISKLFKTFKWNDAVTEKGDNARIHTGVIAQQVATALTDNGLDPSKYAFYCSDTWWEVEYEVPEVVEKSDPSGNINVEAKPAFTDTKIYYSEEDAPEGATKVTRLGVRYEQLLAFIGAATEQRLTSIESRLTALEGE